MSNNKLKSCPFCGGEVNIAKSNSGFYIVSCESCGNKISESSDLTDTIDAWVVDVAMSDECCEKSCKEENATCKKNLQLTRSDIEKMVKLKCNRGGHILYYYLQNDINLAIIYDADKNEYIVHAGNTYIHQIKTLEDAKSKLKEIVVNFICSALRVEE